MATVSAPQNHEHQAQPVSSSATVPMENSINGDAMHHNSIDAFPPSPPRSSQPPHFESSQKSEAVMARQEMGVTDGSDGLEEPVTNVQSGIVPVAPYVEEATSEVVPQPSATAELPETSDISMAEEPASHVITPLPVVTSTTLPLATNGTTSLEAINGPNGDDISPPEQDEETRDVGAGLNSVMASEQTPLNLVQPPSIQNDVAAQPTGIATQDTEMTDAPAPSAKIAREREEDNDEEPSAKRVRTGASDGSPASLSTAPIVPVPEVASVSQPTESTSVPAAASANTSATAAALIQPNTENWGPMTDFQTRQLKQNIQNLKKGRHSTSFAKPVDYVALNIPTYPDIIKKPMDLSTLEANLKEGKYPSVKDFVDDFSLIINNCITFNGANHLITAQAQSLNAQFLGGLRKVPKAGEAAPPVTSTKKRTSSFGLPSRPSNSRGARGQSNGGAQSPTNTTGQTFALGTNGVPLTRRTSTNVDGRPKREIIRPPPRDLPYSSAKPKKKKYQLELKFCEHVLSELKKGRYSTLMVPFAHPVDPIALNIPSYHKIVKKPMDFATITEKLQGSQYENAKEFDADVRLVFENCFKFNGQQHPISLLAKQFLEIFEEEMGKKDAWFAQNAPVSAPQSPDLDSESEQEDEEAEVDEIDEKAEALRRIQEQIAALSASAMALTSVSSKPAKTTQKKAGKAAKAGPTKGSKKTGAGATSSKPDKKASKAKAAKVKPLTNKEKEEIADRIGELSTEQTSKAAEQIKAGLRRIGRHDLADRPDDELEFDISIIPEDILHSIFQMIRNIDSGSDYRRESVVTQSRVAPAPARTKKNKPMGRHEQESAIRRLEDRMKTFNSQGAAGEDSSPGNEQASDDDDSGSESEEE